MDSNLHPATVFILKYVPEDKRDEAMEELMTIITSFAEDVLSQTRKGMFGSLRTRS